MTAPMRFRQYIQVKAGGEGSECDPEIICPADGWVKPEDAPPCADVDCPTDIKHHYKMDDSSAVVAEEKESFDMATIYGSGCTYGHTGKVGTCWKIDGSSSSTYIRHSSTVNTDGVHIVPWTYALWLKVEASGKMNYFLRGNPTSTDYLQPLFSFSPGTGGYTVAHGFWFNNNLQRLLISRTYNYNEWNHFVLVFRYDPILAKVVGKAYANGILERKDTAMVINGEPVGRTESLGLNAFCWSDTNKYYVDDIKIWHRELDSCEVWKLYLSYL